MGIKEKKILVVDDVPSVLRLLNQVFTKAGYKVRTAESAEEAINIFEDEKILVMFFDLNLPDMNGIELCRKIKKQLPISIIYAITGYASLFDLSDCREAGFEDYFTKPINVSVLVKKADQAFEKIERWKSM